MKMRRQLGKVGEGLRPPTSGWVDEDLRILLEDRRHGDDRDFRSARRRTVPSRLPCHVELDLAGRAAARGWPCGRPDDGHLEAVLLVGAVGDRLVEAAMLGLGDPVGAEDDLVQRHRPAGERDRKTGGDDRGQRVPSAHLSASPLPCCRWPPVGGHQCSIHARASAAGDAAPREFRKERATACGRHADSRPHLVTGSGDRFIPSLGHPGCARKRQ